MRREAVWATGAISIQCPLDDAGGADDRDSSGGRLEWEGLADGKAE